MPIRCALAWIGLYLLTGPAAWAQDFSALDPALGKALFERNWVAAPASTTSADGLGPYYNARSCAACHPRGGGSAESAHFNYLSADARYGQTLQTRAIAGLAAEARIALDYVPWQQIILDDGHTVTLSRPELRVSALAQGELRSGVSPRQVPLLAGLAVLDRVDVTVLQALADPADHNGDGISGRVAWLADGQAGRFGWQAGIASLRAQVERALSLDLGLSTAALPAAAGDCSASQQACQRAAAPQQNVPEVSEQMLDLLLAWLRSLPPPPGPSPLEAPGGQVFEALGCSGCHVPTLPVGQQLAGQQKKVAAYTDLLLHDLGPGLAAQVDIGVARPGEWRTAPLWGLAQRQRYLHDGRAANLDEAIFWHDGEAAASVAAYRALAAERRALLRDWLLGL